MSNMPRNEVDVCIIGQGLAGTALAWAAHWRALSVAVVDRGDRRSASRIAAGLVTPITGQRFVKSRRFDDQHAAARRFYQRVEAETGRRFFDEAPMLRLFADAGERERFQGKPVDQFGDSLRSTTIAADAAVFNAGHGGFEMSGARLDVAGYLDASREHLAGVQRVHQADVDPQSEIELSADAAEIPKLGLRARRLIFCEGYVAGGNHWFPGVPFDAAKGEILTVRVPGLSEPRVVHRGIWLAGIGNSLYRVGATYDREHLDATPSAAGREELCARLRDWLRLSFEVVDHHAAVRPIVAGKQPLIGFHPALPQFGYFNGLASKGVLQAPWLAERLADAASGRRPLPAEFDISRRVGFPG